MKIKTNFVIPKPLRDEFNAVARRRVTAKEKWMVISAALLMFLEKSDEDQSEMVRRIRSEAGPDGDLTRLIDEAKAKGGRREPKNPSRITPEKKGVVYSDNKGSGVIRVSEELDAEERERTASAQQKR